MQGIQTRISSSRLLLGGGIFMSGFLAAILFNSHNNFTIIIGGLSISLAALIGTGKLASP